MEGGKRDSGRRNTEGREGRRGGEGQERRKEVKREGARRWKEG